MHSERTVEKGGKASRVTSQTLNNHRPQNLLDGRDEGISQRLSAGAAAKFQLSSFHSKQVRLITILRLDRAAG